MQTRIEARAESLCNLHGGDPNNESDWTTAMDQARGEWDDPTLRDDAYPY